MFQNLIGLLLPPPPELPALHAAKSGIDAAAPARPRKPRRLKFEPVTELALIDDSFQWIPRPGPRNPSSSLR
jgi:hypothetical protein